MKANKLLVLTVLTVCVGLALVASGSEYPLPESPEPPGEWSVPDCDRITGTGVVTFTTDEGLSLIETSPQRQTSYTFGLAALDVPDMLIAVQWVDDDGVLLRSEDAGCQWQRIGEIRDCKSLRLSSGPGETVYAWTYGSVEFYQIDGDVVTALTAPDEVYGMAVDTADALHLRIGSRGCQIYESTDGGVNFLAAGGPASSEDQAYFTVDFDPENWDCALCGTKGAWRTTDAGQTWSSVPPFDLQDVDLVYRFVYSPVFSRRIWARANLETNAEGWDGIFVSDDFGASFTAVVEDGRVAIDQNGIERRALLANRLIMAAHPANPDVLYFVCSIAYDNYGTDLFRYNAVGDSLTVNHIDNLDGINAFAFNPADPSVMYLGLEQTVLGLQEAKNAPADAPQSVTSGVTPNPFNPAAEISFSIPSASHVKLVVYNMAGQRVSTLVDEYMSAGEHAVRWDGSNFASGVYLYRLDAGETVVTRKMVLVK